MIYIKLWLSREKNSEFGSVQEYLLDIRGIPIDFETREIAQALVDKLDHDALELGVQNLNYSVESVDK